MKNAPKERWTPRVTVAAIIEKDGRFLVVEEAPGQQSVINQPAGHLEKGESLLAAVVREVQEETAWQFEPEAVTGIYRWAHPDKDLTYLRFCFSGKVHSHDPQQVLDNAIINTHWLSREELSARPLRSPLVLRCLDDYLAGQRFPLAICHDIEA